MTASSQPTAQPLFELSNISTKLVLDNVYLNGLHALRRFEIRNISSHPIVIKLRSNLGQQIAFQLTNENLPEFDLRRRTKLTESSSTLNTSLDSLIASSTSSPQSSMSNLGSPVEQTPRNTPPGTPLLITTNTAAAAAIGVFGYGEQTVHGHQFNQLFNYVNHIDEIRIEPAKSQKVILAFLPDARQRGRRAAMERENEIAAESYTYEDDQESFDYFEINGLLFFFGYIVQTKEKNNVKEAAVKEEAVLPSTGSQDLLTNAPPGLNVIRPRFRNATFSVDTPSSEVRFVHPTSTLAQFPSQIPIKQVLSSYADENLIVLPAAAPPDQSLNLKFRSKVCRSILWTDISETGIMFEDCVVGGTYFKDFTIWNKSEIDLYWTLNTQNLGSLTSQFWLKFGDYDTGESLDYKAIPAYSHRRIRVTFKPKEVGEYNYDLQLENANDTGNIEEIGIHAIVRSVLREETLVVSSGNVLDFGDSVAGAWTKQKLVLRNVSENPLEINFGTENDEVLFQLRIEDFVSEFGVESKTLHESSLLLAELRQVKYDKNKPGGSWGMISRSGSDLSNPASGVSSRTTSPSMERMAEGHDSLKRSTSAANPRGHLREMSEMSRGSEGAYGPSAFETAEEESRVVEPRSFGGGVGIDGEHFMQIDELVLKPGTERTIEVCNRPERETNASDYRSGMFSWLLGKHASLTLTPIGKLIRRNFRILLSYGPLGTNNREKKAIQCKARTCTCYIEVTPKVVNFGDTDVGTLRSVPIQIRNCSELAARVELRFISKVLNCFRDEIIIPARQSIEVKLDIYPRKVNPDYRKQITVVNLLNRDNEQIIEVRSCNIDQQRITFHSLFYRIFTPTSTNFIDFGSATINSPTIRSFTIENISRKKLVLSLNSSSPDEFKIYMKGTAGSQTKSSRHMRKEKILESIADKKAIRRGTGDIASGSNAANVVITSNVAKSRSVLESGPENRSTDYLDLASPLLKDVVRRSPRRKRTYQPEQSILKSLKKDLFFATKEEFTRSSSSSNVMVDSEDKFEGKNRELTLQRTDSFERAIAHGEKSDFKFASPPETRPGTASSAAGQDGKESQGADSDWEIGKINTNSLAEMLELSQVDVDTLLLVYESMSGTVPPLFPRSSVEEKYVRILILLRQEMEIMITNRQFVPVTELTVLPENEANLVLVYIPSSLHKPWIQGKPKKTDAKIFIRLSEFDRETDRPEFENLLKGPMSNIPVRELMLRSSICRSVMELGQKNINFGNMDKGEQRTKTLVIRNRSEAPLLYAIRKSGSIASGDVLISDAKLGVIRGYGKKEVEFVFEPSLAGTFHERLVIENVQDPENDQTLVVKANIRKPSNFFLERLDINFGVCLVNETCLNVQQIVISNTSTKQTRTFEVRFDPSDLKFKRCEGDILFNIIEEDDELEDSKDPGKRRKVILSKEMEEQIESLEQKLKIAKRKGRDDKVQKLSTKLEKLRSGKTDDDDKFRIEKEDLKPPPLETMDSEDALIDGIKPWDEFEGGEDGSMTNSFAGSLPPSMSATMESATAPHEGEFLKRPSSGVVSVPGWNNTNSDTNMITNLSQLNPTAAKFRRTPNSIIFTLEPRAVKTISVTFRTLESFRRDLSVFAGRQFQKEEASLVSSPVSVLSALNLFSDEGGAFSDYCQMSMDSLAHTNPRTSLGGDIGLFKELCEGRIMVNEYKNTDVVKKVSFASTVCYDHTTYIQALSEMEPSQRNSDAVARLLEPVIEASFSAQVFVDAAIGAGREAASNLQSEATSSKMDVKDMQDMTDSQRRTTASPKPSSVRGSRDEMDKSGRLSAENLSEVFPQGDLQVELGTIDLNRVVVNEERDCYFTVINTTASPSTYATAELIKEGVASSFTFDSIGGEIGAKETKRIYLKVTPRTLGRQSHSFLFTDMFCGRTVPITFNFFAIESAYLRFMSLDPFSSCPELDLGICYVDAGKRFAKVAPLEVTNISETDLHISISSNLAQQCFIFQEASLENFVNEVLLQRGTSMVVFIALQPYLGSSGTNVKRVNSLSGGDYGTTEVRNLIGGIKFSVYVLEKESLPRDDMFLLMTQMVRFNASIGQSVLGVSQGLIDFGICLKAGRVYKGSFWVYNLAKLPLEYAVETSSSKIRLVTKGGKIAEIEGKEDAKEKAGTEIAFELACDECGFLSNDIVVRNTNNSLQSIKVEVRVFVDPKFVVMGLENLVSVQGDRSSFPCLRWAEIYVVPDPSSGELFLVNSNITEHFLGLTRALEITNTSSNLLSLKCYSDCDVECTWSEDLTSNVAGVHHGDTERWRSCGNLVVLQPGSKKTLSVPVPRPNFCVSLDLEQMVTEGRKITRMGLLLIEDTNLRQAVKVVELITDYCVSRFETDVSHLDLGKIGYINSWNDVKFKFAVKNLSDVPLLYDLILPEWITVKSIRSQGAAVVERRVESCGSHEIEGILNVRAIDNMSSGNRTFSFDVVNACNPKNSQTITLAATLTTFELKFEGLNGGQLVLPQLVHPHSTTALPCDAWFTVFNTSDHDVKFEIGTKMQSDVGKYVRIEVLSRATNSPMSGPVSLPPRGNMEVRVRAFSREDSKLIASDLTCRELLNNNGIYFGKLWVKMRQVGGSQMQAVDCEDYNISEEVSVRTSEDIPLSGVLIEGPSLSVSERRIELKSAALQDSDSDDEEYSREERRRGRIPLASPRRHDGSVESITILNLSSTLPAKFEVAVEYPMEFPSGSDIIFLSSLDEKYQGYIPPGGRFSLEVSLANSKIHGVSEDVKLHIIDLDSINMIRQTVFVSIVENKSTSLGPKETANLVLSESADEDDDSFLEGSTFLQQRPIELQGEGHRTAEDTFSFEDDEEEQWYSDTMSPTTSSVHGERKVVVAERRYHSGKIIVRGCKRITDVRGGEFQGFLYELDLGQQDLAGTTVQKKLTLENPSPERITYRIRSVNESDKSWIAFSRSEGVLEGNRAANGGRTTSSSSQIITLSFMTHTRGIYTTYLVIENSENPSDVKMIRASVEIVGRQNVRRTATGQVATADSINNHVFDVFMNGVEAEQSVVVMENLFYENEYSARSFVIYNRETTPLEFTIKSNLSVNDPSELIFSLSRSSAKLFRTLTVEPESHCRVYLHFRPSLILTSEQPPDERTIEMANIPEEKTVEISINCRLVKDYQKVVTLNALCRRPQIKLSRIDFSFRSLLKRGNLEGRDEDGWATSFDCEEAEMELLNLLCEPLDYEIINDSIYFRVELKDKHLDLDDSGSGHSDDETEQPLTSAMRIPNSRGRLKGQMKQNILIILRKEAILKNAEFLRRVRIFLLVFDTIMLITLIPVGEIRSGASDDLQQKPSNGAILGYCATELWTSSNISNWVWLQDFI